MGLVWEKKRFAEDWERRMKLFNALDGTVVGYRAEIWGMEREERNRRNTAKIFKIGYMGQMGGQDIQ